MRAQQPCTWRFSSSVARGDELTEANLKGEADETISDTRKSRETSWSP